MNDSKNNIFPKSFPSVKNTSKQTYSFSNPFGSWKENDVAGFVVCIFTVALIGYFGPTTNAGVPNVGVDKRFLSMI